ncbi:MAG: hypothetical protein DSZ28_04905 [Thiothrix sp.]|nr:MAG: hypothetical protein DSZ28_04905 [Thiothrix sp.]
MQDKPRELCERPLLGTGGSARGHVTLLPAQHVKPFVRGNKNDYNDALAIAEASRFAQIRPVAVKTVEQQSIPFTFENPPFRVCGFW